MQRTLIIATILMTAAITVPAHAISSQDQLLLNVSYEFDRYVKDVDPATLSRSKLAVIYSIMHGPYSEGEKGRLIRSTIGGRNTLRGLLFN